MTPHKSDKSKATEKDMPSQRFEEDNTLATTAAPEEPTAQEYQALQQQLETLTQSLKEAQDKAESHWERLLRKEAEYQNGLRRAEQDVENARKFSIEKFAGEMLQVLDSLGQGASYAENGQASVKDLIEGMKLTESVILSVFEKFNITPIDPLGEAFNPAFHEAISMQETNEVPPNQVVMVVQKGYMLHNRLLRPARVVVSKAVST